MKTAELPGGLRVNGVAYRCSKSRKMTTLLLIYVKEKHTVQTHSQQQFRDALWIRMDKPHALQTPGRRLVAPVTCTLLPEPPWSACPNRTLLLRNKVNIWLIQWLYSLCALNFKTLYPVPQQWPDCAKGCKVSPASLPLNLKLHISITTSLFTGIICYSWRFWR